MEKICTAVPYPMVADPGWGLHWGVICTDHPTWYGGNVPTDTTRESAEAFAEACACAHPDHERADGAPQTAINAAIVAAMLEHAHDPYWAERLRAYQWCDMTPVVRAVHQGPTDPEYCPDDVWVIEVQYSSKGGRALYGVNRNNVPHCYAD
jgi:hypothetical protein